MKCTHCQRENKPTSRFCIFCGSPLEVPQAEPPSEVVPGPVDTLSQEQQALQEEVRRLREIVVQMNARLSTLERMQRIPAPTPEPAPIPPWEPIPARPMAEVQAREAAPTAKVPPLTQPPPSPPSRAKPAKAKEGEWEWILGGNWLARIGVLALIIGVAFLLKLAADKDWIGPIGWIALGIVTGLAMLGLGYYWKIKYPTLAQAITGGGIAILYLSAFAAFALFDLINFYLATGFLLVVSVTSATLALWHNSMALAIIGIFGAFSAPFILAGFAEGATTITEASRSAWLLLYVIVVDLGVLALSTFRNWRWFTLLALLSSLAAFGAWHSRFGEETSLLTSQGSLTLIFLIFVGSTMLYHIVWRRTAQEFDYALMVINAAAYFGISYALLRPDLNEWIGGFTFALSLFYGSLAYIALKRGAENIRLSYFALGISLIFLTIAIPIQLGDVAWVTIAWAAEGAILVWLSFSLRMPLLRLFSYAVLAVMAVRLLFFDARLSLPDAQPFLNERFLAFFISIVATYLSGYLIWRNRESLLEWERATWPIFPILIVGASLLVTVSIPIELGNSVWTTIAWAAEGAVLVWLSLIFRMPLFRVCSYAVFAAMAVRLLFFDTRVDLATFQPILNERFLAFLVSITALYFASWREMKALRKSETTWSYYPAFLVVANFLTLWLLSAEIINYFDSQLIALAGDGTRAESSSLQNAKNLSLTGLWAFYAVIVLVIGIAKRSRFVRVAGLVLLAVPIIKVFAYDVIALEQVYRIIAFVGLGVLLVISGYLYQRYSKSIKGFFTNK
jgi:uncharacterized membrane protein